MGVGFDIPEDFELPSSGNDYLKLEEGKHKIRILQGPAMSFVDWKEEIVDGKEKKVKVSYKYDDPDAKKTKGVKLNWDILVYNYDDKKVKIWNISQRGIIQNLIDLNNEVEDLTGGDLTIIRKGKGMNDTTYTMIPSAPSVFDNAEVLKEIEEDPLEERLKGKDDSKVEGVENDSAFQSDEETAAEAKKAFS